MTFTDNEPALTAGISTLAAAIIALLVAFGLPITDQQRQAILAVVVIVAPIAVALLTRPHVTPTMKVDNQIAQALVGSVVPPPVVPPPVLPPTTLS